MADTPKSLNDILSSFTDTPERLRSILDSFKEDNRPLSIEQIGEAIGHTHGEYGADELFVLIKSIYGKFCDEGEDQECEFLVKVSCFFATEVFKIQRECSGKNKKLQEVIEEYFKNENKTG